MTLVLALAACQKDGPRERVLFNFETAQELDAIFWQCRTLYSLSNDHATLGSNSLRLDLFPSDYPGFAADLPVRNWRRYRELRFDVYNPSKRVVPAEVRIDDRAGDPEKGDWFGKGLSLRPGMNHVVIPFDALAGSRTRRRPDLGHMRRIFIYLDHPAEKNVLYIDALRLRAGPAGRVQ